jgi:DNA ligase-1
LEKVRLLAEYFRRNSVVEVGISAAWFSGRPFPSSHGKTLRLGGAVLSEAMGSVGEVGQGEVHQSYLKHSDVGEVAAELLKGKQAGPAFSVQEVDTLFHQLHEARGPLAKVPLLSAGLRRCSELEAKYLVKIITGELRIGLQEGLVEEGVGKAFGKTGHEVRQANLLLGDIGQVARLTAEGRLGEAKLTPFRPLKFMLASPEETADAIWKRMTLAGGHQAGSQQAGGDQAAGQPAERAEEEQAAEKQGLTPPPSSTVWLEDKYDGVRCQLHKCGGRVALYSRDLKEITSTFLELADSARKLKGEVILDGEIVAMRGDSVLPFSELQKRLGRQGDDLFLKDEVPVQFVAFDLLWRNGEGLLERNLKERRQLLEALELTAGFRRSQITQASSAEDIEAAFVAARGRGNEGLMIKNPSSLYAPGRRGFAWLKLKKPLATLDCVVVGAEYGHGKRNKVLSDYTFSVRDEESGELKIIGKAYSGLTDAEIDMLTQHFLKTAIRQRGRYFEVKPDTVLEIAFDRIQPSDRHNSGLAMRFPRIVRIRTDKSVEEIDTLATAWKMVGKPHAKDAKEREERHEWASRARHDMDAPNF